MNQTNLCTSAEIIIRRHEYNDQHKLIFTDKSLIMLIWPVKLLYSKTYIFECFLFNIASRKSCSIHKQVLLWFMMETVSHPSLHCKTPILTSLHINDISEYCCLATLSSPYIPRITKHTKELMIFWYERHIFICN